MTRNPIIGVQTPANVVCGTSLLLKHNQERAPSIQSIQRSITYEMLANNEAHGACKVTRLFEIATLVGRPTSVPGSYLTSSADQHSCCGWTV